MGKYTKLQDDIFSIFSDAAWVAEDLKTYPTDFVANDSTSEFIRVNIIASGDGINLSSISGILMIEIYVSAGRGPSRANFIADRLDVYLVGKSFDNAAPSSTQFMNSSMSYVGRDADNQALSRYHYSIPFNYFGVL